MTHRIAGRAVALGLFLLLAVPVQASAQDPVRWQVVDLRGAATVTRPGVAPVSLTDKVEVEPGDQIRTELDGRVILRHGGDTVLIAPNSLVAIPAADTGLFTRVLQTFGTVLVNVAKRPDPHFEVRTPFLAAIVKGTTFTVSADSVGSAVQVVEGVVSVVDAAQRQSVTVTAGQTARINSRTGDGLHVDSPRQTAPGSGAGTEHAGAHADGTPRISQPIGLAAIDAVKASGGLLRNDDGHGSRQGARAGAERSGLAATSLSDNRANAPAGSAAAQGGGLTALIHAGASPARLALSANGNGNGFGNGNGNAGGNGNGNAGGNGNGNAGGNGNGNAGGNGNGNAGGNGNGNAGGNGNGNAGGNGNGHGHP